jgi:MFS superfamily sulfate permease-like transporter
MFQFGRFLTLFIGAVALMYIVGRRRHIQALPALQPFIGPLVMMAAVWLVTVLELVATRIESGVFPGLPGLEPGSVPPYTEGSWPPICCLFEHIFGMIAYVWLAWAVWRLSKTEPESRA